jgi:hypothetical protein
MTPSVNINIGGFWPRASGVRPVIILHCEPNRRKAHVSDSYTSASGMPEDAYRRRALAILHVGLDTVPSQLEAWLAARVDQLKQIASCYQGLGWGGDTRIGCWSREAGDLVDQLQKEWDSSPAAAYRQLPEPGP